MKCTVTTLRPEVHAFRAFVWGYPMDEEIPGRRDWRTDNLARAVTGLNGVPPKSLSMGDHRQALRDYLLANDLDAANRPVVPERTWRETLSLGWPGRMAIDLYDAFTLPTSPDLSRFDEQYPGADAQVGGPRGLAVSSFGGAW